MINFSLERLLEFISPEGNCECCGTPCKTAFCEACRKELNQTIDNSEKSTTEELPT